MLIVRLYYYIFSAFIYAITGICEAMHHLSKRPWQIHWKRLLPQKTRLLPTLHLHQ